MTFPAICESPIFIIGSPRSGTSILAWALAQHSALTTSEESSMFFELFRNNTVSAVYERAGARPDSRDWLRKFNVSQDEFVASIGLGLNALVTSRSDGKRWVDQTPANTMIAPALAQAFPGARFVHILRDGRSVVNSMINFAGAFSPEELEQFVQAGAMPEFARDFSSACRAWSDYAGAAHDFVTSHPERALTVRNESLREDPASGFRELLSFLDLEFEAAVPEFFRDRKLNSSFPDSPTPGGRSTPVSEWTDEQRATFDAIAGPTAAKVSQTAGNPVLSTAAQPTRNGGTTVAMTDAPAPVATAQLVREASESATADETNDPLDALADELARLVRGGAYTSDVFRRFERRGVHVTPVHFYSPIPDTSELTDDLWARQSELVGIDMNDEAQLRLLTEAFPQFRAEYEAIPTSPDTNNPFQFYLGNGMFDGTDALVYYCMLRHLQPRRVIEVGSGNSTRLAAQAARLNGSTELVCIEPYPDATLQAGFPGLTKVIASRVEELSLDVFGALDAGDVLFIDSSHVVKIGGDVTYLYLDVLPRLKPGVVVHVHDIFFPREYPRAWNMEQFRFWNEQYLLQAFLAFNSDFEVLLANSYLGSRHAHAMREAFPTSPWWGGGSFWMRRKAR